MHITSRDNSLLRQARSVRDGKIDELIYVEGLRLCEEVLRSQLVIEAVVVSEELLRKERVAPVIKELSAAFVTQVGSAAPLSLQASDDPFDLKPTSAIGARAISLTMASFKVETTSTRPSL